MAAIAVAFGVIVTIVFLQLEADAQETSEAGCLFFVNRSVEHWCSRSDFGECSGTLNAVVITNPEVCESLTKTFNLKFLIKIQFLHDVLRLLVELLSAYVAMLVVVSWCHKNEKTEQNQSREQFHKSTHKKEMPKRRKGCLHFKVLYQCAPCMRRTFTILTISNVLLNISSIALTCVIGHIADNDLENINCLREHEATWNSAHEVLWRVTSFYGTILTIKSLKFLYSMLALFLVSWKFWKYDRYIISSSKSCCCEQLQIADSRKQAYQLTENILVAMCMGYLCISFAELATILCQRSGIQGMDLFGATRAAQHSWCHYCTCTDDSLIENQQQMIVLISLDYIGIGVGLLCCIVFIVWPMLPMRSIDSYQTRQLQKLEKPPKAEAPANPPDTETAAVPGHSDVASQNRDGFEDVYVEDSVYTLTNSPTTGRAPADEEFLHV